jgi:hypothetical protein
MLVHKELLIVYVSEKNTEDRGLLGGVEIKTGIVF